VLDLQPPHIAAHATSRRRRRNIWWECLRLLRESASYVPSHDCLPLARGLLLPGSSGDAGRMAGHSGRLSTVVLTMLSCVSENNRNRRFEGLCAQYRADVFRFALWLARDGAIAEDVVQETFMRAWRAIDSLDAPEAARRWLLVIARREHARLHDRKRHTTVSLDHLVMSEDSALAFAASEDHSDVDAAISSLDADYRQPLMLHALLGYSTDEIAGHMGLTRAAVLTRLHRARQKLRLALGTTDKAYSRSIQRTTNVTHAQQCAA